MATSMPSPEVLKIEVLRTKLEGLERTLADRHAELKASLRELLERFSEISDRVGELEVWKAGHDSAARVEGAISSSDLSALKVRVEELKNAEERRRGAFTVLHLLWGLAGTLAGGLVALIVERLKGGR